ncbi:MAG: phosphoglycerate dehydrogenase [Anaerolineae bacterium]|nr:MAG: phosphoglycerate dehydrogenase [Anaerolineae bacterium]
MKYKAPYRVLISDKLGDEGIQLLEEAEDAEFDIKLNLDHEILIKEISSYDALIVRSGTQVDAQLLESASRLKVVGRAGIGIDNIDLDAATRQGIIVMNTPQPNAVATAELTMALLLAIGRNLPLAHATLLNKKWDRSLFVGQQVYRKTLGIIGFGRIGRLVATRAQSFDMEVIAYDPFVSEEIAKELDVMLVDLEDLLEVSDYISLHTLLTPDTKGIIDAEAIESMKEGVFIINTARGHLINEEALFNALTKGKIKGAALDVYSSEPPFENQLIGLPNVIHTPHLGANTKEAQRDVATQMVRQILDALRGKEYRNAINMPFSAGPDFEETRPHLELAEKLGMIQTALATAPIRRVEVEVKGDKAERLVRPVAAALLKGLLAEFLSGHVNYINAPIRAAEAGISITQTKGIGPSIYPNLVSCRVYWDGGERLVAGVLFGDVRPRIVQVDDIFVDAKPEGSVIIMSNDDKPGVIGQAGTILANHNVSIGEWRMGRHHPGGQALSFISVDSLPSEEVLGELRAIEAVAGVKLVIF